jgi:indole-3-glycerol phosphate synthase
MAGVPSDTHLDRIVAAHRAQAEADLRPLDDLVAEARRCPPTRGFASRLATGPGEDVAVIAEVKRKSPSKGVIDATLDPAVAAADYAAGGAACVSVLTDEAFFGGSAEDLRRAARACTLPMLRKDFTVSGADVCDARLMGADGVLLIVAALSDAELAELSALARQVGIDALVEVHDEAELERALASGATLVGVNQRDLATFSVDGGRAARLAAAIPPAVVAVAESGVSGADDVARLADAGFQAVLVGEALVRAADRRAAVAALTGHGVRRRPAVTTGS